MPETNVAKYLLNKVNFDTLKSHGLFSVFYVQVPSSYVAFYFELIGVLCLSLKHLSKTTVKVTNLRKAQSLSHGRQVNGTCFSEEDRR